MNGGQVLSIDISEATCQFARGQVSDKTNIICQDSVEFLWNYDGPKIDLLYLDSYDYEENNPHPSMLHHIMELVAVMPHLEKGSIIVVDDHDPLLDGSGKGKGTYVKEFMEHTTCKKIFESYQIGWVVE